MSFRYDVLNLEVIDKLKLIYSKPSTEWTDIEALSVYMGLEAMEIVASYHDTESTATHSKESPEDL